MSEKLSRGNKRDDTGAGAVMRRVTKKISASGEGSASCGPLVRRSPRFNEKAKPSAAIIEAKKNARLKQVNKKPVDDVIRDIYQAARDAKDMVRKPTGIVYDKHMVEHYCLWDSNYPECPERFTRVLERCEVLGLISRCLTISSREATELEILAKHTPEQIQILKVTENCGDDILLEKLSSKYDAIYIHPSSYRLSLLAAGSTIELVDAICTKRIQNGMAIVRPPGHHAMKSEYCGYCFFNNVALAANHALQHCNVSRILIIDWDVHHGQATQQMFYDDPRVVYFSIHRYEHGAFWPNLHESNFNYVGNGKGEGFNFNVPLNATGMMDSDYLAVFQQVLLPMAAEFQPELIMVSAGYDAAIGCPEGEMEVTPACYAHLLSSILGLASGKVAVVLEGGYCLKSLAEGAALTLRCLLGDPCPALPVQPAPSDSIRDTILDVIYSHRDYWQCFQLQDTYKVGVLPGGPVLNAVKSNHVVDSGIELINKQKEDANKLAPVQDRHYPVVKFLGSEERPDTYLTRNCYPVQSEQFINDVESRLNTLITNTNLTFSPQRVCFVYDERMLKHKNTSDLAHPEKPERISNIYFRHEEYGLLDRCHRLQTRVVSKEELLLLHTKKHIEHMQDTRHMKPRDLNKLEEDFRSVYLHPSSYDSACLAAGSLLQVVDSVLNGESRSGIAVVRPPGHHAEEDEPCGFCVFNSVSLAAKYAVEVHGLKRVLLLDWDVHHGNGSQHMFISDPHVLYLSLHRYDNGSFFPGSKDANYTIVGSGPGIGFNVNIPWNKRGISDGDYIAAFHQIVLPICYQFAPELVLVSAGFDAAVGDPLGGCKVSPEAYSHMTHWLSALANGRIILSLEGGYNVTSISYAMTLCTKALLGDPLPPLQAKLSACPSAVTTMKNVIRTHSKYWSCLKFDVALPKQNVLPVIGEKSASDIANPTESMISQSPLINSIKQENNNLPVSKSTEIMSNSFTKLNLNEEINHTISVQSSETMHSNICILGVNSKEHSNFLESPMELSECSTNIVASSSNSSFEGESQAWSHVSSASISESPEEMVIDSVSPCERLRIENLKYRLEEDFCALHKTSYSTPDQENRNIPQILNEQRTCVLQNLVASKELKGNVSPSTLRPSTLNLHNSNMNEIDFLEERKVIVTDGTQVGVRTVSDKEGNEAGSNHGGPSSSQQDGSSQDGATASGGAPKQSLVDYLSDNMQLLLTGEMYAVVPLPSCPHLDTVREVPANGIDSSTPCLECGSTKENWVCLFCYSVHCGRYINEHMMKHGLETSHPLTLSFSDLSVWCYGCEAYIDNHVLYSAKNAVHRNKFGDDLPWSYGD